MIIELSSFTCGDCRHDPPYKYHRFYMSYCSCCKKPLCKEYARRARILAKKYNFWS